MLDAPVDAFFSNAALHWMWPPEAVAARIARALVPGGRLVAEMAGRGNLGTITRALDRALAEFSPSEPSPRPWYFPGVAEYAALLEGAGLEPCFVQLFDRPTPLEGGADALADWVRMFAGAWLALVPRDEGSRFIQRVVELCRPTLLRDGIWVADYRRLRLAAVRGAHPAERSGETLRGDGRAPSRTTSAQECSRGTGRIGCLSERRPASMCGARRADSNQDAGRRQALPVSTITTRARPGDMARPQSLIRRTAACDPAPRPGRLPGRPSPPGGRRRPPQAPPPAAESRPRCR